MHFALFLFIVLATLLILFLLLWWPETLLVASYACQQLCRYGYRKCRTKALSIASSAVATPAPGAGHDYTPRLGVTADRRRGRLVRACIAVLLFVFGGWAVVLGHLPTTSLGLGLGHLSSASLHDPTEGLPYNSRRRWEMREIEVGTKLRSTVRLTCEGWAADYGVTPARSWGSLPLALQNAWRKLGCEGFLSASSARIASRGEWTVNNEDSAPRSFANPTASTPGGSAATDTNTDSGLREKCEKIRSTFGVCPGRHWGMLTVRYQQQWHAWDCDALLQDSAVTTTAIDRARVVAASMAPSSPPPEPPEREEAPGPDLDRAKLTPDGIKNNDNIDNDDKRPLSPPRHLFRLSENEKERLRSAIPAMDTFTAFITAYLKNECRTLRECRTVRALKGYWQLDRHHRALAVVARLLHIFRLWCDAVGVRFLPTGGTLLGIVRHQGLLPWENDGDVVMSPDDLALLAQNVDLLPDDVGMNHPLEDGYSPGSPDLCQVEYGYGYDAETGEAEEVTGQKTPFSHVPEYCSDGGIRCRGEGGDDLTKSVASSSCVLPRTQRRSDGCILGHFRDINSCRGGGECSSKGSAAHPRINWVTRTRGPLTE